MNRADQLFMLLSLMKAALSQANMIASNGSNPSDVARAIEIVGVLDRLSKEWVEADKAKVTA